MPNSQASTLISQLFRFLAAILPGIVVATALLVSVEFATSIIHPLPPDFGSTQEEMCAHVARYPQWFLAAAVPAWSFTALAATWIAKRIGTRDSASPSGRGRELSSGRGNYAAITIGLLLILAVLFNVSLLPYPSWFKVFAAAGVIAGALIAIKSGRRRLGFQPDTSMP